MDDVEELAHIQRGIKMLRAKRYVNPAAAIERLVERSKALTVSPEKLEAMTRAICRSHFARNKPRAKAAELRAFEARWWKSFDPDARAAATAFGLRLSDDAKADAADNFAAPV